jgi:intracellular multiplication protein IcmW
MPNLDLKASHEFWKNYEDPMIYRVISFMETAEGFTLDGDPALEQSMTQLGETLEKLTRFELGKEDQFVDLCCHLKTSRILRLLQAIDTIDPGSASKLLMFAEEHNSPDNPMAGLFLRRNIIFERLRLLARVFAPERFDIVLKALEHENV